MSQPRLGPGRRPALSLDMTRDVAPSLGQVVGAAPVESRRIDLRQALIECGCFDADEISLFPFWKGVERCTYAEARRELHWGQLRLERTRKRLERGWKSNGPKLREAIERQLAMRVPTLDPAYLNVMQAEQLTPILMPACPQRPILSVFSRGPLTETELLERKRVAAKKLAELMAALDAVRTQTDTLAAVYIAASAESEEEQETAVLENRDPSVKIVGAVDQAAKKLADQERRLKATAGAVVRQRSILETIEGEISATLRRRILTKIQPAATRINELVEELAQLAAGVMRDSAGQTLFANDLFALFDPSDPGARQSERDLKCRVFNAAIPLAEYKALFEK